MSGRCALVGLLALMVCRCGGVRAPALVPLPNSVGAVAVLPPNNRTGEPLLIAGGTLVEQYILRTERVTVPDMLAAEARFQLARRGFAVVAAESVEAATGGQAPADQQEAATVASRNDLGASVLYIDLRRWEPDVMLEPRFIIASLEVVLMDASTGRMLWKADRPSRPVPTYGAINFPQAYAIAARAVIDELLAGLGPEVPVQ
jgi:hypothetical protein